MIRHIVWWVLKLESEGADARENARLIVEKAGELQGLACLTSLEVSCEILQSSTVPGQVILTSTHENEKELQNYQDHPLHREFAAFVGKRAEKRYCLDFALRENANPLA